MKRWEVGDGEGGREREARALQPYQCQLPVTQTQHVQLALTFMFGCLLLCEMGGSEGKMAGSDRRPPGGRPPGQAPWALCARATPAASWGTPCTAPGLSLLCLLGMPLPLSLWFSGGKHRLLLSGLFLSTTLFHNCQVEAR